METSMIYEQMVIKIIAVQEAIIGPLAIEQASRVDNLTVDWRNKSVKIAGEGKVVVEKLIESYKELFGLSSVEVSKDAVSSLSHLLSQDQIPAMLAT